MNILIFGAGPGLSRSVAKKFGDNGFDVTLVARTENKLKTEVELLKQLGINASYIVGDTTKPDQVKAILDRFDNRPEVILYNAFMNKGGDFSEETWESLSRQLDVNMGGAFTLLKNELPYANRVDRRCLFFTGGGFGINPMPQFLGVSIGKAALRNLVLAAAESVNGTAMHIATLTVFGMIGGDEPRYAPDNIAEEYWKLYLQKPDEYITEIQY